MHTITTKGPPTFVPCPLFEIDNIMPLTRRDLVSLELAFTDARR